ncbi:hypothetical protein NKR19_g7518 [Coniochaeta hoffmannii]|uniref:BTB domain-containing protein n=1 Tax=Coniochaeta hoffmannii TaxID=91930 RepID=A0AA38R757_9PEZI|nr:hypothetical protein NKR19_g7518 [Coniochaeta hoffmannii]
MDRTSGPKTPDQTIVFDDNGDLRLDIGTADEVHGQISFLVCSRALVRASPVFKPMLSDTYAEARPAHGEWVVKLPEDSDHVDGLRIIMDIVHGSFNKIHKDIEKHAEKLTTHSPTPVTDILYHVAVMADKWHGGRIWVAWVFGDEEKLKAELDLVLLAVESHAYPVLDKSRHTLSRIPYNPLQGRYLDTSDDIDNPLQHQFHDTPYPSNHHFDILGNGPKPEYALCIHDHTGSLMPLDDPPGETNQLLSFLDLGNSFANKRGEVIKSIRFQLGQFVDAISDGTTQRHCTGPRLDMAPVCRELQEAFSHVSLLPASDLVTEMSLVP